MPVTDADLRVTLAGVLGETVRAIERRAVPYASSYSIETLEVSVDGQAAPLRIVFKDLSRASMTAAATSAKPASLVDAGREIEAYRQVLRPRRLDAPSCLGSVADPDTGRYWLFLEEIDGLPLWQIGEPEAWEAAARWLGDFHGRDALRSTPRLMRYDAAYFRPWMARALEVHHGGGLERVAARWKRVVERLCAWPATFVHGEFYPSNVLVQPGPRIRPLDWEMAGTGPGLLDVAALVAGNWTAADRDRLALAYHDSLPVAGRPSTDDFLDALAHCRLYIAVKWLGWSADWAPPEEHAHDWLSDALACAEELGL